jgi:hypothetical protein
MACSCTKGSTKATTKCTVKKPNGQTYKTYNNKMEADAAAKRVGGTVTCK